MKRWMTHDNIIRIICTACAFGLSYINNVRSIGNGAQWALAVNCIGFCMFPMIVMRYSLKDFLKLPYYIWTGVFLVLAYPAYLRFAPGTDYNGQTISAIINVGLYGIVAIRLVYQLFEKKASKEKMRIRPAFIIWFAMLFLAAISINKAIWPIWFIVMFTGFFFAPSDKKMVENIFLGVIEGIIISFFVIQSKAFLYRPYDYVRYKGFFQNSNQNSMFYLFVYVAWLGKLAYLRFKEANKWYYRFCLLMASAMWAFEMLTIGRVGLLAFVVVTIFFVLAEEIFIYKTKFIGFLKRGLLMFLLLVVTFVPVYGCVRYIPALRHHPVWFDDYNEETSVFSWDPMDSEKYVSLKEFFETFLGRFDYGNMENELVESESTKKVAIRPLTRGVVLAGGVDIAVSESVLKSVTAVLMAGSSADNPFCDVEVYENALEKALGIRRYIYGYFLQNMTVFGHEEVYPNVWIKSDYMIMHAHSSYLQFAYCYGILTGVLLLGLSLGVPIGTFVKMYKKGKAMPWYFLFTMCAILGFAVISIAETACFVGYMLFSLLNICILPYARN